MVETKLPINKRKRKNQQKKKKINNKQTPLIPILDITLKYQTSNNNNNNNKKQQSRKTKRYLNKIL